jgi:hypothetical protein
VYLYGSAALFGAFRARKTRSERIHSLQASQNELAEPYKYSNTTHTSSTIVCGIPWDEATARVTLPNCDFQLRCAGRDLKLTRGRLPKKLAASTLENFQSEYTNRRHTRRLGKP